MACPSFASSSEAKLYYVVDPDPSTDITGSTLTWDPIRMTGESMDANITTTISDEITPQRSYADSTPTQGEIVGGFNFELSYESFDDFIIGALQSSEAAWATTETIQNESTKQCWAILKIIPRTSGTDYYVFRGCQVDGMTLTMQPGALVTGAVTVQGVGVDDVLTSLPGTWTLASGTNKPLMSSTDSLKSLSLSVTSGSAITATFQSLELQFGNQLRQQQAVGTGSIYAAGVASGRFQLTMNASLYYLNADVFTNFIANNDLTLTFDIEDSEGTTNGNKYGFSMTKLKVTAGGVPQAGGPGQDMVTNLTFQAFESASNGTIEITKTVAA